MNELFARTDSAWLSRDGRRLYLSAYEVDNYDLYVASRAEVSDEFGPPLPIRGLNTLQLEHLPSLTSDELLLAFATDLGDGNVDISLAARASRQTDFEAALPLSALNTPGREEPGSFSADGRRLYFESEGDLFEAELGADGSISWMAPIAELNSPEAERHPVISADGLWLYFSRDGSPSRDVFVARRATDTEVFTSISNVVRVNSMHLDFPTWVSGDHCTLLMASDRISGSSRYDLYFANRAPLR